MKKTLIIITVILLICVVIFIILRANGYRMSSIINKPSTIDLTVRCSNLTNILVAKEVDVTVNNNSSRTHNNVTIRVTGYDMNDNITKEKLVTFDRTLEANGTLTKPITLPAKTKRCDCVLENSNPN